jgi:hypothetical protein
MRSGPHFGISACGCCIRLSWMAAHVTCISTDRGHAPTQASSEHSICFAVKADQGQKVRLRPPPAGSLRVGASELPPSPELKLTLALPWRRCLARAMCNVKCESCESDDWGFAGCGAKRAQEYCSYRPSPPSSPTDTHSSPPSDSDAG